MRSAILRAGFLAALFLAGCVPPPVKPVTSTPDRQTLTQDQRVVWQESDDQDASFANSRTLYDDPALQAYVQSVVNRLYPELGGGIRVHLLKSTVPNAFMMGNGSCYVELGMLTLLQDQAQLAIVLGHEGIHFVNQHAVTERGYADSAGVAVLGIAVPIIGPALAYSSITGYSRDMETQADRQGYQRFLKAGYDPVDAMSPFTALDQYSQAMDIKQSYFYADHPKLQDRIAYFKAEVAKATPTGITDRDGYVAVTQGARLWVLQDLLARQDYKALIFLLEDKSRSAEYPDTVSYYLGRAYALRGHDGDAKHAESLYRDLIANQPSYAPPYGALGEMLMREGDKTGAAQMFRDYVRLAPGAPDRAYIDSYIKKLTAASGGGK